MFDFDLTENYIVDRIFLHGQRFFTLSYVGYLLLSVPLPVP